MTIDPAEPSPRQPSDDPGTDQTEQKEDATPAMELKEDDASRAPAVDEEQQEAVDPRSAVALAEDNHSPAGETRTGSEDKSGDESEGRSSRESSAESGETTDAPSAPPLPNEPVPESTPAPADDGWEYHWNPNTSSYWFYNRFTQAWQQENPRLATPAAAAGAPGTAAADAGAPPLPAGATPVSAIGSVANGYNPAIHGSYDPNAWYAQGARAAEEAAAAAREQAEREHLAAEAEQLESGGYFNRVTGQWQRPEQGPYRHSDEAKSRRQLNAYFDVDAAANMHDGRSLKAERQNRKLSRAELKAFKEKRKARKEEKRRAWLRD